MTKSSKILNEYISLKNFPETTRKNYESDIRQFLNYLDNNKLSLKTLTTYQLSKYKEVFINNDYSPSTCNRKLSSINGFIEYAKSVGLAEEKLQNIIDYQNVPYREANFMQFEEVEQLKEKIKERKNNDEFKERDDLVLLLALSGGLRLAEIRNVDIRDLDGNKLRIVGKRNKERFVYLNSKLVDKIKRYYNKREDKNETKIFISKYGNQLSMSGMRKLINKRLKEYGLDGKNITPHSFRHTFATMLDEMNVSSGTIQKLLGHSKREMTERYIHSTDKAKIEASDAVSTILFN